MRKGRAVTLSSCLLLASIYACQDFVTPGHAFLWPGSRQLDFSAGPVVTVTPANMGGWAFTNDQTNTACTTTTLCALVTGPTGMPSGSGSAELATQATTDGIAIARAGYTGVRLDQITELSYSTYRQSADAGNNLAIALQLNVDYDLTDADSSYQGRLVYEPYRTAPGGVPQGTWQRWDARAGKWWGTRATVKKNGVAVTNSCVQASPCTWAQVLALFPNLGIHKVYGAVVLKAGSGWAAFRGDVDAISIGVAGVTTTFDFELTGRTVSLLPPDTVSAALLDSLGAVSGAPLSPGQYRKDVVIVEFENGTVLSQRQAAIDSVGGVVIGGKLYAEGGDGRYFVRITGGTTAALLNAVRILQRQPGVGKAIWWSLTPPDEAAFRRPVDSQAGWRDWRIDPATPDASRANWALEYVRAPMAWGCSTGSFATTAGVVDDNIFLTSNLRANVDVSLSEFRDDQNINDPPTSDLSDHGSVVSSVMAAVGNDSSGMTGMAWRVHLILQNRTASAVLHNKPFQFSEDYSSLMEDHIVSVAARGADIINLSYQSKIAFDSLNPEHVARVTEHFSTITRALGRLASAPVPRRPLLVISAGNMGIPARGNGYAWAKASYPNQILVVGGLTTNGTLWSQSNTGPLVDVYAPAMSVRGARKNDVIISDDGTSFAAPLVAGVAILLKDFDPSLSASDMIRLIKAGARTENGLLKLDAYGALKQASLRVGAPLCGNRVHSTANGDVLAERVGSPDERLFTSIDGQPYTDLLNVLHGGRRIQIGDYLEFAWNSSSRTWASTPLAGTYHQDAGGAFLSWYDGTDHDGHTYAIVNGGLSAGGSLFNVDLYPNDAFGIRRTLTPSPVFAYSERISDVCTHWLATNIGQCSQNELTGSGWREQVGMMAAFAPQGNFVLLGVNRRWHEQIVNPPSGSVPCTWPPLYDPGYCATYLPARDSSVNVELWLADTSSASTPWTRLKIDESIYTRSGLNVSWLAIDETGTEMVWELGKDVSVGSTFTCTGRVIEYRALPGHATVPAGVLLRPPVILPDGCGRKFGPATFAPYRAGKGAPQGTMGRQQSASLRPKR